MRDYKYGVDATKVGDLVSFLIGNRRTFGNVVQIMSDYTMRVRSGNHIYRLPDNEIERETF